LIYSTRLKLARYSRLKSERVPIWTICPRQGRLAL
jgi:hypothetical protein